MEATKNMLELWVETQNQLAENWMNTAKEFQTSAQKNGISQSLTEPQKAMEKGIELYKTWYEQQKNILQNAVDHSIAQGGENAPEHLKQLMEQQKDFTHKWMDAMNALVQKQSAPQMPEMPKFAQPAMEVPGMDKWTELYQNWFEQLNKTWAGMNGQQHNMHDTFTRMTNAMQAFTNMNELWKPYQEMMKGQKFDFDSMMSAFNMDKYKDSVRNMMSFMPQDKIQEAMTEMNKYFGAYQDLVKAWINPAENGYEKFQEMMPNTFGMDYTAVSEYQKVVIEKLQKLYDPFAKIVPESEGKELSEGLMAMQKHLSQFQAKALELSNLIGTAAAGAGEAFTKELQVKAEKGEYIQNYNDFYMSWLGTLEEKMIELFQTDEFSRLQGDVIGLQMDMKLGMNKAFEHIMAPCPVAKSSEVDQLIKQVHDLKTKVRKMERELSADKEAANKTATAKKTATTARKTTTRKTATKAEDKK